VIAASVLPGVALGDGLGDLALTLLAGAAVNLYIVGLNQCEDVEIDRINKPWLPIPAGRLSVRGAWRIVVGCAVLAGALAVSQGWVEVVAVGSALAIGTAYSSPPLRLKRFPALAAASISVVRACVVNLGVYLHFASSLGGRPELSPIPDSIVALTLFVLPFSFAIAVLKDVPDAEGDRRFRIGTFTVRLGARAAFRMGMAALVAGYLGMAIAGPLLVDDASGLVLAVGHLACLGVLLGLAAGADLNDPARFTRFYLRVWALFFVEYLLVPAAVLAN
jgi:homogentisate phytyltransferase / homogentisate geranylgeranyltransferase